MIYIIYKVCSNEGVPLPEPFLYAVTDKKDLCKEFTRQRNMNLFTVTKKDTTEEEEYLFYRMHSSYYLDEREYADGVSKDAPRYTIVSSLHEYSRVMHSESDAAYEISRSFRKSYYDMMSDEMKAAMDARMYSDILSYVDFMDRYFMPSFDIMDERPKISTSMFQVFMYIYGDTLDIGK